MRMAWLIVANACVPKR